MKTDTQFSHLDYQSHSRPVSDAVAAYLHQSMSANTHRAYEADLAHFFEWGGSIPTTGESVAEYLAAHAEILSMATLDRRTVAISRAHEVRGYPSPTQCGLVRTVRRGIKRVHGKAQWQAAPLTLDELSEVLAGIGGDLRGLRDRALLLLGFAGAFRRSELVGLDRNDLETAPQGLVAHIRRSKTDQTSAGRRVGIPEGVGQLRPVAALRAWLAAIPADNGPLFRRVDRHRNVLSQRLSGEAVSLIVKDRVAATGLDPVRYSGHSLRAGFATSAALAGVAGWRIRKQTGHASDAMLSRYIRDGGLFGEASAAALL